MSAEKRLRDLGIELPVASTPGANYVPFVRVGDLIFLTGQLSQWNGERRFIGKLGRELGVPEGQQAARLCALNLIAHLRAALGDDLDRAERCVRVAGYVNATPEFDAHPQVINGASDLFVDVFGDRGRHTRVAVGVNGLPYGVAVEVEAIFQLRAERNVAIDARLVDITTLEVDAIVNAANSQLAPGGGVCGAIHAAAGPELALACRRVAPCPTGEARMTPGFRLPARYVIHAVGPVWAGGARGEPELLASTYRAAISIAKREGLRSLAFPAISTGIFGYPLRPATALAVSEVRAALAEPGSVERVTFACFSPDVLAAYEAELA